MITQEQLEAMVAQVAKGEGLNNEDSLLLIQTLAELDQRGSIAQGIVQFVLEAAEQIYKDVSEQVIKKVSIRDHAKVKQLLSISSRASRQLVAVTQLYMAQVYAETQAESAVADADPGVLGDELPA